MKRELLITCKRPKEAARNSQFLPDNPHGEADDAFAWDLVERSYQGTTEELKLTELHLHFIDPSKNIGGVLRFLNLCKYLKMPLVSLDFSNAALFSRVMEKLISSIPPSVTSLNLRSWNLGTGSSIEKIKLICDSLPATIQKINLSDNQLSNFTIRDILDFDPSRKLANCSVILSDNEVDEMTDEQRQAFVSILIPPTGSILDKLQFVDAEGELLDATQSKAVPLIEAAKEELLFGKPSSSSPSS